MSKVKGDNVIVYFYDQSAWKMYACALSASLTVNTELIETSEVGSGNFATFRATKDSYEGALTGLVNLNLTGTLALSDLRGKQLAHNKLLMRFQRTDNNSNVYTDEGFFFITKTSDEGAVGGMNNFSVDIKGSGTLTTIYTPTPITQGGTNVITYDYISAAGGENSFVDPILISKNIVGVFRQDNYLVITAGTPLNLEVKYYPLGGQFEFQVPLTIGEHVLIQYQ